MAEVSSEQQELITEFITETRETLEEVEPLILDFESMDDIGIIKDTVDRIFRLFHSLKGGAGFLELRVIEKIAHTTENLLQLIRKDPNILQSFHVELFTQACDLITKIIAQVEQKFSDQGFDEEVHGLLNQLKQGIESSEQLGKRIQSRLDSSESLGTTMKRGFVQECNKALESAEGALMVLQKLPGEVDLSDFLKAVEECFQTIMGQASMLSVPPLVQAAQYSQLLSRYMMVHEGEKLEEFIDLLLQVIEETRKLVQTLEQNQQPEFSLLEEISTKLVQLLPESERPKPVVEPAKSKETEPSKTASTQLQARQDIRVSLNKIDSLINLTGELVIAEAMVVNHPQLKNHQMVDLEAAVSQLNKHVRELQEIAMSMRVIPIAPTFKKMVRLVHDVSKKVGKQVQLEIRGEDTEVDKTLLERIADPLLHILRNAIDHGIEMPAEREQAGKNPMGRLLLEARHVGNEVWIIVEDDGKGLNREKILKKAIEKKMMSAEADPCDEDLWKLILEPSFSTAEKVTDLSGRGVGMDVVKRNIENLRGRIDIRSATQKGSTFILRIPLTLTIVDGLLVRVGDSYYALPIFSVKEVIQPEQRDIAKVMDKTSTLWLRDEHVPIVKLFEMHHIVPDSENLLEGNLVVVEEAEQRISLLVDEVLGQQQIVVKALPKYMGEIPHLAGCTILNDGSIGMILDLNALIESVKVADSEMMMAG